MATKTTPRTTASATYATSAARDAAIGRIRTAMEPALAAMAAARTSNASASSNLHESRTIAALGVRLDWTAYPGGTCASVCTPTERGTTTVEGGPAVLAAVAHAAVVYTEEIRAKYQGIADGQIAALELEAAGYAAILAD